MQHDHDFGVGVIRNKLSWVMYGVFELCISASPEFFFFFADLQLFDVQHNWRKHKVTASQVEINK